MLYIWIHRARYIDIFQDTTSELRGAKKCFASGNSSQTWSKGIINDLEPDPDGWLQTSFDHRLFHPNHGVLFFNSGVDRISQFQGLGTGDVQWQVLPGTYFRAFRVYLLMPSPHLFSPYDRTVMISSEKEMKDLPSDHLVDKPDVGKSPSLMEKPSIKCKKGFKPIRICMPVFVEHGGFACSSQLNKNTPWSPGKAMDAECVVPFHRSDPSR